MLTLVTVDDALLGWVIAVEAVLLAVGVLVVVGHGAMLRVTGPRRRRRLDDARAALNEALEGQALTEVQIREIRRMEFETQVRVFADLASSVVGQNRERLVAVAQKTGLLARAEAGCRSVRWWRRLQGARLFTILGGGEQVVPRLFDDRRVEVRTRPPSGEPPIPPQRSWSDWSPCSASGNPPVASAPRTPSSASERPPSNR